MLEPRTIDLKGAEQGAKRAAAVGLELERCAAVRARRMRVEKGGNLLLEEVSLKGAEKLFGLGKGQPDLFDALIVLLEGNDIGDGLFLALIAAHDELKFDTHMGASPGSSGRGMIQAIVPELIYNPQHLPTLERLGCMA